MISDSRYPPQSAWIQKFSTRHQCVHSHQENWTDIYFLVYVDDMSLLGKDLHELQQLAAEIGKEFEVRTEEKVKFLGLSSNMTERKAKPRCATHV